MIIARFRQFQVVPGEHGPLGYIFAIDDAGLLWQWREPMGWAKFPMPEREVDNRTPFEKLLDAQEQLRKAQKAVDEEQEDKDQSIGLQKREREETPAETAERFSKLVDWKEKLTEEHKGGDVFFVHNDRAGVVRAYKHVHDERYNIGNFDLVEQKGFKGDFEQI